LQNTLINTLIKNISNDPNHKGKKTIKITQHKYGTKKQKAPRATQPRPAPQVKGVEPIRSLAQQQQQHQARTQYRTLPQQQQLQQQVQQQQQQQVTAFLIIFWHGTCQDFFSSGAGGGGGHCFDNF
jgi:hypothetical protein